MQNKNLDSITVIKKEYPQRLTGWQDFWVRVHILKRIWAGLGPWVMYTGDSVVIRYNLTITK